MGSGNLGVYRKEYAVRVALFLDRFANGLSVLEFPQILGADDVSVRVEVSRDLTSWQDSEAILLNQSARNGNSIITQWSLAPELEDQKYARVIVTQNQ